MIVGAGVDEVGDVCERADAAAGADSGAVECSSGASKFQLAVEGPVFEQSVDEAGVEDVAGAGGVDDGDAKGRSVKELFAVEGEDAFLTKSRGSEAAVVAALHFAKSLLEIGLGCEAGGKVAADDEVVDVADEILDVGIEFVEVGDDGNAGFAGPGGGEDGSFRVVTIDVESAGIGDPFAVEVSGAEGEPGVKIAADENSTFALGIDEDEGSRAGSARDGDDASFDTGVGKGFAMESRGQIVT